MVKKILFVLVSLFLVNNVVSFAQFRVTATPETIRELTPEWIGERLPDGRPYVSDNLLERLSNLQLEAIWAYLRAKGYHDQFEGNWILVSPDIPIMAGRALTAQYMPERPDFRGSIRKQGTAEGLPDGPTNSWPINLLNPGDVYVADSYGKIVEGTLIGDNLGTTIQRNSQNGVIFYGSLRDMADLREMDFKGWIKGHDPSYLTRTMLTSINMPIRIGRATVLPGDVIFASEFGVIFIPAYLAEECIQVGEFVKLRDEFAIQRLQEGVYLPGDIDTDWSDKIRRDFIQWLRDHPEASPMTREELDKIMEDRYF